MKDLLTYIAKSLVENPDAVSVTEVQKEDGLVLELRVAPDDMGKVIGKHGRIAKEIRTIIKAAALRDNVKVSVDILD
ncbi:MAG: KH domain-containing protein [Oscillospiraceae bacterium]|nr:KH domain-containing protein [Oscillospiraceae bacterium]